MSAGTSDSVDPADLRVAIEVIDGMSQRIFERIEAMATLALRSLEAPEAYSLEHLSHIGRILEGIVELAANTMNDINVEAEAVGCNYKDAADRRRMHAFAVASASAQGAHSTTRSAT